MQQLPGSSEIVPYSKRLKPTANSPERHWGKDYYNLLLRCPKKKRKKTDTPYCDLTCDQDNFYNLFFFTFLLRDRGLNLHSWQHVHYHFISHFRFKQMHVLESH